MNRTEAEKRARAALRAIAEHIDGLPEDADGLSELVAVTERLESEASRLSPGWV